MLEDEAQWPRICRIYMFGFIFPAAIPPRPSRSAPRFKYQTSTTADFSAAPLRDFAIQHEDWLDKRTDLLGWNEQNWKAYDLGPSLTATFPSGTRYVRIAFQSSTSSSNAQIGSVRLYASNRTLTTDELVSDLNSATSGHLCAEAVNLAWTAATDVQTDYNVGRVWSGNASQPSRLTYRVEELAGFSFRVYHTGTGDTATTLPSHVMAWVGYTTQDNDLVPLALQVDTTGSSAVAGAPGWYSTKVKPADLLIQGARYLIIGLDPTTRGASDTQIGAVAVSELKKP